MKNSSEIKAEKSVDLKIAKIGELIHKELVESQKKEQEKADKFQKAEQAEKAITNNLSKIGELIRQNVTKEEILDKEKEENSVNQSFTVIGELIQKDLSIPIEEKNKILAEQAEKAANKQLTKLGELIHQRITEPQPEVIAETPKEEKIIITEILEPEPAPVVIEEVIIEPAKEIEKPTLVSEYVDTITKNDSQSPLIPGVDVITEVTNLKGELSKLRLLVGRAMESGGGGAAAAQQSNTPVVSLPLVDKTTGSVVYLSVKDGVVSVDSK